MTSLSASNQSSSPMITNPSSLIRWQVADARGLIAGGVTLALLQGIELASKSWYITFLLVSAPALIMSGVLLFKLFKNGHYLIFSFSFFVFYEVWVPWMINFVFGVPFSLWRATAIDPAIAERLIKLTVVYGTVYLIMAAVAMQYLESRRPKERFRPTVTYSGDNITFFITVLCLGVAAMTIVAGGLQSREVWLTESDVGDRFLLRISALLLILTFALALFSGRRLSQVLTVPAAALIVATLLLAFNGYRNVLVSIVLLIIVFYGMRHPISGKQFIVYALIAVGGFIFVSFLAVTRALHLSVFEIFTTSGLWQQLSDVMGDIIGAPQQMNIIAADLILEGTQRLYGYTYFESILNVLPNGIRTEVVASQMTQDRIVDVMAPVLPSYFVESGHNMGATVFLEGMLNFGIVGPVIACAIYLMIFSYMEASRFRGPIFLIMYLTTIGNVYMPAWYGSSNFTKITLTNLVLVALLFSAFGLLRARMKLAA